MSSDLPHLKALRSFVGSISNVASDNPEMQAKAEIFARFIDYMIVESRSDAAFAWLKANAAINDQVPKTLVHGDYGLNNLLVDNNRVTCILDWVFAHIGNPAYDLGYFYFIAESLGSWDLFLKSYEEAGGTVPDQTQLNYHIVFAATRLGVMVCQTVAAFRSGQSSGLISITSMGGRYYDITIQRIAPALDRALAD